ncbi:MAG: hypothetical protein RDV48_01085 [Candidatus Eremiobacteraeota bacterium]|nr:hypothetical protein [Candidatus Eremiobacteraeota bacterium]
MRSWSRAFFLISAIVLIMAGFAYAQSAGTYPRSSSAFGPALGCALFMLVVVFLIMAAVLHFAAGMAQVENPTFGKAALSMFLIGLIGAPLKFADTVLAGGLSYFSAGLGCFFGILVFICIVSLNIIVVKYVYGTEWKKAALAYGYSILVYIAMGAGLYFLGRGCTSMF